MELVDRTEIYRRLESAREHFSSLRYQEQLSRAMELFNQDEFGLCEAELGKLPSPVTLLAELLEKLKSKSVYKTLDKIAKGVCESDLENLKGLFSLGTHIVIEMDKGSLEYTLLLNDVYEKIGRCLFSMKERE